MLQGKPRRLLRLFQNALDVQRGGPFLFVGRVLLGSFAEQPAVSLEACLRKSLQVSLIVRFYERKPRGASSQSPEGRRD
jgi:hypothetical protein